MVACLKKPQPKRSSSAYRRPEFMLGMPRSGQLFEELLERFNFTVTEDTPLDMEVAIDPEMLGKVFESLILQLEKDPSKDRRKLTGSFYTPRPIVHMMCSEALRQYLLAATSSRGIDVPVQRVTALL